MPRHASVRTAPDPERSAHIPPPHPRTPPQRHRGETARTDPPHHRLLQPFERGPHLRKEDRLEHRPGPRTIRPMSASGSDSCSPDFTESTARIRSPPPRTSRSTATSRPKVRPAPLLGRQHLQPQQTTPELRRGLRLFSGCILRRGLQRRRGGLRPGPHHHDGHLSASPTARRSPDAFTSA